MVTICYHMSINLSSTFFKALDLPCDYILPHFLDSVKSLFSESFERKNFIFDSPVLGRFKATRSRTFLRKFPFFLSILIQFLGIFQKSFCMIFCNLLMLTTCYHVSIILSSTFFNFLVNRCVPSWSHLLTTQS